MPKKLPKAMPHPVAHAIAGYGTCCCACNQEPNIQPMLRGQKPSGKKQPISWHSWQKAANQQPGFCENDAQTQR